MPAVQDNLTPRRRSGREDSRDVILRFGLDDNNDSARYWSDADESVLCDGVIFIKYFEVVDVASEEIAGLLDRDTVFLPILPVFGLIPFDAHAMGKV